MSWYSRPVNLPRYVDAATAVQAGDYYEGPIGVVRVESVGLPCVGSFAGHVSFTPAARFPWTPADAGIRTLPYRDFVAVYSHRPHHFENVSLSTCPNTLM